VSAEIGSAHGVSMGVDFTVDKGSTRRLYAYIKATEGQRKPSMLKVLCASLLAVCICSIPRAAQPQDRQNLLDAAQSRVAVGDYDSAVLLASAAVSDIVVNNGPVDSAAARALRAAGVLCHRALDFTSAESFLKSALQLQDSAISALDWHQAGVLQDLGDLYLDWSRYPEAKDCHEGALDVLRGRQDTASATYAIALNRSARARSLLGGYGHAELLYRRAVSILESTAGTDVPYVSIPLTGLAEVVCQQRRFVEAEELSRRAISILQESSSPSPPDLIRAIAALARARRGQGEYQDAEPLYREALRLATTHFGAEHLHCIRLLNDLAALYVNTRQADEAQACADSAAILSERLLPAGHIESGTAALNLGGAQLLKGFPSVADSLFFEARRVHQHVLGPNHQTVAKIEWFLAACDQQLGNVESAPEHSKSAFDIVLANYVENGGYLTDYDAVAYSFTIHYALSAFLTLYFDVDPWDDAWRTACGDMVLTAKGIVGDDMRCRQRYRLRTADPSHRRLLSQLHATNEERARLYSHDPRLELSVSRNTMDSLADVVRQIELELAEYGEDYRQAKLTDQVPGQYVGALLPESTALIQYYWYTHSDSAGVETSRMACVVVDSSGVRAVRDLGETLPIDTLVAEFRRHVLQRAHPVTHTLTRGGPDYDSSLTGLYQRVWKPIDDVLADKHSVLISPDGTLSELPFSVLLNEDGRFLIEEYAIGYVSAARDLLPETETDSIVADLFVLGDPDFDATPAERQIALKERPDNHAAPELGPLAFRSIPPVCQGFNSLAAVRLPATQREVEHVRNAWVKNGLGAVNEFSGAAASEDAIKRYAPGNRMIHIATHGFYVNDICHEEQKPNEIWKRNPGLHCGLLLAGANWHGEYVSTLTLDDGILFAEEIHALNLSGTQLVVLSACETGLGDVSVGQGTYGLPRAFRMAGAQTVVCALWPVADNVTAEIMNGFYDDDPVLSPFQKLRAFALDRIRTARELKRFPDPYYWAPFIAVGPP